MCDKAKVVYERWCVTKLCVCVTKWFVKGGVRQSGVKAVCERWCVTKRCVTKLCVKNVCDKEKRCVTKRCVTKLLVKDGV